MTLALRLATPLLALTLAACASTGPTQVAQAPVAVAAPTFIAPVGPSPAQTTQVALAATSIANGFVDPAALALMTAKDSAEANSAQFYALQFGRPGAPRQWSGDKGSTGTVGVGPYVRVNNLDCRDFTHTVKIGGTDYVKKGTACRENGNNWTVVQGAA
jgi:surface antigen